MRNHENLPTRKNYTYVCLFLVGWRSQRIHFSHGKSSTQVENVQLSSIRGWGLDMLYLATRLMDFSSSLKQSKPASHIVVMIRQTYLSAYCSNITCAPYLRSSKRLPAKMIDLSTFLASIPVNSSCGVGEARHVQARSTDDHVQVWI